MKPHLQVGFPPVKVDVVIDNSTDICYTVHADLLKVIYWTSIVYHFR
jgi:hypothetical protein